MINDLKFYATIEIFGVELFDHDPTLWSSGRISDIRQFRDLSAGGTLGASDVCLGPSR